MELELYNGGHRKIDGHQSATYNYRKSSAHGRIKKMEMLIIDPCGDLHLSFQFWALVHCCTSIGVVEGLHITMDIFFQNHMNFASLYIIGSI